MRPPLVCATALALILPNAALAFSEQEVVDEPSSVPLVDSETSTSAASTVSEPTAAETSGDHEQVLAGFAQQIALLERQILGAQEQVDVLKDTVFAGVVTAGRTRILHVNEMGSRFSLLKATYRLDGGNILDKEDVDGSLAGVKEIVLFDGPLEPGEHRIEVSQVLRAGSLGVFTYVEGYKFKVESKYTLKVVDGRINSLRIVTHDKGESDISQQTKDRIGIRYDFEAALATDDDRELPAED